MFATLGALVLGSLLSPANAAAQVAQPQLVAEAPSEPALPDILAEIAGQPGGWTGDGVATAALRNAATIRRADFAIEQARAAADRAFVAVWPRVEVSARYTRLSEVNQPSLFSVDPATVELARSGIAAVQDPAARALFNANLDAQVGQASFRFPQVLDNFVFHAGFVWPVSDIFLAVLPSHRGATAMAQAAEFQRTATFDSVSLNARESLYNYVRARAAERMAALAINTLQARRGDLAAFVEAGTIAPFELTRIDSQLATARAGIARAQGAVRVAETAVRTLIGDTSNRPAGFGEPAIEENEEARDGDLSNIDALIERALTQRADVRALHAMIRGRTELVTASEANSYPRVLLSGNVDVANPNQRIVPQTQRFEPTWDVSAIVSWSPNDFFSSSYATSEARAARDQVHADLAALGDAVRIEVTQAASSLESAKLALPAAREAERAAGQVYEVRVVRFRAGTATTTDIIDATNELLRTRLDLVNASIDVRVARARLRRALGEHVTGSAERRP